MSDGSVTGQRGSAGAVVGATPDWRTAAAWWICHELGDRARGLLHIMDVRALDDREAWVAVEVAGSQVVVGLRHEQVPGADDGWYRLLYLTECGAPTPLR